MSVFVYIGLGSNLGESGDIIQKATHALEILPETSLCACSSVYRSKPLANMQQPDFLNAVAKLKTSLDAVTLLDQLQRIENEFGRVRKERWGARTLDLDILIYGDEEILSQRLIIPHSGMAERDFVLIPLSELEPELVIPGLGSLSVLLEGCEIRGLQKLDHE